MTAELQDYTVALIYAVFQGFEDFIGHFSRILVCSIDHCLRMSGGYRSRKGTECRVGIWIVMLEHWFRQIQRTGCYNILSVIVRRGQTGHYGLYRRSRRNCSKLEWISNRRSARAIYIVESVIFNWLRPIYLRLADYWSNIASSGRPVIAVDFKMLCITEISHRLLCRWRWRRWWWLLLLWL